MVFERYYRTLFDTFGSPLGRSALMPASVIDRAAKSLGIVLPAALRDYYLVAGRETKFNRSYQQLMLPNEWRVDRKRLIFMEENQCVVWWGVSIRNPDNDDPPVSLAANEDDQPSWQQQENRHCSVFIAVILHLQAVSGGLTHRGNSAVPKHLKRRLKEGWTCYGTVNRLTAYSKKNQVVCIEPDMGVCVAAKTKQDLDSLRDELSLTLRWTKNG